MRRTAVDGLRIGALCAGMGGLEIAAQAVVGGTVAWHAETDPHASRVLAHHWPGVPNLGDLTTVDWAGVEPVDVVTAGFPCQDLSTAGRRLGLRPGTRSGVWTHVAYACLVLRPRLVLIENVGGILSASAHSEVEPCPWCLGDTGEPHLRALGAVLGDLAALGYDAAWGCLRASDVGAPHGRARVFIAATDTEGDPWRFRHGDDWVAADADSISVWQQPVGQSWGDSAPVAGLPCSDPAADASGSGRGRARSIGSDIAVGAGAAGRAGRRSDAPAPHATGYGRDERRTEPAGIVGGPDAPLSGACDPGCAIGWDWGDYATAVHSWHDATRCVPPPVQTTGRGGGAQLSALFTEWMMALPLGHVTDPAIWAGMRPSTARNAQLTILGNGCIPQQAEAAYRMLLPTVLAEGRAA